MQFSVGNASNATAEIAAADLLPLIRVFTAARHYNATSEARPQLELDAEPEQPWSIGSAAAVGGPWGTNFSAVCYFFGRELYRALGGAVPIGLMSVNWGATDVSTWMPARAVAACEPPAVDAQNPLRTTQCGRIGRRCNQTSPGRSADCCSGRCFYYSRGPWAVPSGSTFGWCDEESPSNRPSGLYNQMVALLLRLSIAGVVWYQASLVVGVPHASLFSSYWRGL